MSRFPNIDQWLRDTPPNVLRFPIFNVNTPCTLIVEAAAKFGRTAHFDLDTGLVTLVPRRAPSPSRKSA